MKIAFDLDGTLYNTFPVIFNIDDSIMNKFGYKSITQEEYKSKFQSKDWTRFYRDLGIKEEHLEKVTNEFYKRLKLSELPKLIPGAKEILCQAEEALGNKNIYIITNENKERVKKRFERDGLVDYLRRVDCPLEGKSKELYDLTIKDQDSQLFYIGDLVSDGEDCIEARNMGATNLKFCGIVHPYSMNTKEAMKKFIEKNKDFAQILNNLNEIPSLLKI